MMDPDGGLTTYQFDAAGRLDVASNPQSKRTTFSYDATGARTATRLGNGGIVSYLFDNAGRLTGVHNRKSDGSLISSFDYALDGAGNRLCVLEDTGVRTTWTYDATNQLVNEHRTAAGQAGYNTTFVYDPVGNRLTKNAAGALTTAIYDAANQLQISIDTTGTTTFIFDASGNQQIVSAQAGRTTNTWDYENQLIRVQLPNGSRVTMAYNADFLRVRKES
jgi:YD repeat-containing protein